MRTALVHRARFPMPREWSPYPRYRLYSSIAGYHTGIRTTGVTATDEFETEICRRFDIASAVCAPMARTGIFLALRELVQPGQKVVMSPLTIVDVVNAVILAGAVPVFVDIDRDTCGMSPAQAEMRMDCHTGAVLLTHLHGLTAGAHAFRDICDRRRIPLIEDAAQAFGALENGKRLGTVGDVGIYSFGFYKNVTGWRGGMVVSHDRRLVERVRQNTRAMRPLSRARLMTIVMKDMLTNLATWPPIFSTATFPWIRSGNARVNNWLDPERKAVRLDRLPEHYLAMMRPAQANACLKQLDGVDHHSIQRVKTASCYAGRLSPVKAVRTPPFLTDLSQIYTHYPIQYGRREALLTFARKRGRDFSRQHLRNCADLPEFREFFVDCPNARAAARELVLLPTYPSYPLTEARQNVEIIEEFIQTDIRDSEPTQFRDVSSRMSI